MRQGVVAMALLLGAASCAPAQPRSPVVVTGFQGGEAPPVDRSGKGAVLCVWRLYVAAQEVGKRCFSGQDAVLQAELAKSIDKTEAFILQNSSSHLRPADLAAQKAAGVREMGSQALCSNDPRQLYLEFRNLGPDALRASTDDMLSIAREPVLNPCV